MSEETPENPLHSRTFQLSAIFVILLIAVAATVAVVNAMRPSPDPSPQPTAESPATPEPTDSPTPEESSTSEGVSPSVCGLSGEVLESARLTAAPEAVWEFQDLLAYPTSDQYGPGDTSADGVRTCFQHSPEGAVFAAANAAIQSGDPSNTREWLDYYISAEAPRREELVNAENGGDQPEGVRMEIAGFRLLDYSGSSARVDLALRVTGSGTEAYLSMIHELVWEQGDWRLLPINPDDPFRISQLPNAAGHISWSEG